MMGYMEIAGHLAVLATCLATSMQDKNKADKTDKIVEQGIEALREAELIMFRLALDELRTQIRSEE